MLQGKSCSWPDICFKYRQKDSTDAIVRLFKDSPFCFDGRSLQALIRIAIFEETQLLSRRARYVQQRSRNLHTKTTLASNPLDVVPNEMPFDVPYGAPISLKRAETVIHAAVAEAKKLGWKMNVAVGDSSGNLVAFQRMDGAMLASIQIAQHKARAAVTFRRPTKVFEDGVNLMHLNYRLAFDGMIASRGGIPLIDQGDIIGAIGCSGGTDSQDEVVSQAGAGVINRLPC